MTSKRKAVFFDRDGTLIEEVNFLSRVEDLRLFPPTFESLRRLKDNGYLIIVITNQSGIGRGIYDRSAMEAIHLEMQHLLEGMIDGFYFCPHLPTDGCECRKPNTAMIEAAKSDFAIETEGSWFVGDKSSDVATGQNANIGTILVLTGYGMEHREIFDIGATFVAADLIEAVDHILADDDQSTHARPKSSSSRTISSSPK